MLRHMILSSLALLQLTHVIFAEDAPKKDVAKPAKVELEAHEQAFIDMLSNATMVGTFSVGHKPDAAPKQEKYTIQAVRKVKGNDWIVEARVTYGKIDVPVPVPVQMEWAGDTPVLQVTDLNIPLIGNAFTARVMFYEDYYAGAWWHGKVGGHMWGKIERIAVESDKIKDETPNSE